MKLIKYLKFGNISSRSIMNLILVIAVIIYIMEYVLSSWHEININSTNIDKVQFEIYFIYFRYFEPVLKLILIKMVLEYFYKLLELLQKS
ncbi:MAG: hypothetical protein ACK5LT_09065 [Lachnospirales bacterium]